MAHIKRQKSINKTILKESKIKSMKSNPKLLSYGPNLILWKIEWVLIKESLKKK